MYFPKYENIIHNFNISLTPHVLYPLNVVCEATRCQDEEELQEGCHECDECAGHECGEDMGGEGAADHGKATLGVDLRTERNFNYKYL